MNERTNPFADLSDFDVKQAKPKPDSEIIDRLAEEASFPSRSPQPAAGASSPVRQPQRRYVTGRNKQINIKATDDTINRLYSVADRLDLPLGAVLDQAIKALIEKEGLPD